MMSTVDYSEPFERFRKVYEQARATGMSNYNAMVVASVDPRGQPSTRVVLLKSFDEQGFVFYTNLESRKGIEILANPRVSLNFYWRELDRQVRILGPASLVDDSQADAYFATRDRRSQLGAWASHQSRPLSTRATLVARAAKFESRFIGKEVPRPPHWSGFRVAPDVLEFWIAGSFRLHRRIEYRRQDESAGWSKQLLNP